MQNRDVKEELNILLQKGFSAELYTNQEVVRIEDLLGNERIAETRLLKIKRKTAGLHCLLIDRLVVKDFDEDDMHRMADSVGTAFYEGEGDDVLGSEWRKAAAFLQ